MAEISRELPRAIARLVVNQRGRAVGEVSEYVGWWCVEFKRHGLAPLAVAGEDDTTGGVPASG